MALVDFKTRVTITPRNFSLASVMEEIACECDKTWV
jgi:hypothetical protein